MGAVVTALLAAGTRRRFPCLHCCSPHHVAVFVAFFVVDFVDVFAGLVALVLALFFLSALSISNVFCFF